MTALAVRESGTMDLVAAAWGGVVASIGLMVGSEQDLGVRLGIGAAAFLIGGFLAGVRAGGRRRLHGVLATVIAYLIYGVFLTLANVISTTTGPDAPEAAHGGLLATIAVAGWAVVWAILGATLAERWLRPSRKRAASP